MPASFLAFVAQVMFLFGQAFGHHIGCSIVGSVKSIGWGDREYPQAVAFVKAEYAAARESIVGVAAYLAAARQWRKSDHVN